MVPRLAAPPRAATPPESLRDLDEMLFTGPFRALNSKNQQVKGVSAPTVKQALALIDRRRVATVFARLAESFWAVDIDVPGLLGHAITEQVAMWAHRGGLWHLVRPSGGADGRHHVIIRAGEAVEDLEEFVLDLRRLHDVAGAAIDLRKPLRLLSAPHRAGGWNAPLDYARAHADLIATTTTPTPPRRRSRRERRRDGRAVTALVPRPRSRRPLPATWQTYLDTGQRPQVRGGRDRSTVELIATATMLRAGHTVDTAWALIEAAHPRAMSKARNRGRTWWTAQVWNTVVRRDLESPRLAPAPAPEVAAAVAAARDALQGRAWMLPPRQRPSVLLVGHALLDRAARENRLRVPVPQRNLALDTGLSRPVIAEALRLLHGHVGTLHTDVLDRRPDHRATTSYEFEIPAVNMVSQTSPPSSHTPVPHGVWAGLPRTAHQVWRALELNEDLALNLDDLCVAAQITSTPQEEPTESQRRSTRAALTALAAAGMARCDAEGRWARTTTITPEALDRAAQDHATAHAAIQAERVAYRGGSGSTWAAQQRAALLEVEQHYRRWRAALPHEERIERTAHWQMTYAALSIHEQEQVKGRLAARRRRAGLDETQRLTGWIDAWTDEQWEQRVTQRAAACATLAPPERAALVAAWQRHRDRHHLPIGRRSPDRAIAPGHTDRDDAFLHSQSAPAHTEATLHA